MTTLTELKTKAEAVGLDRGIVRLYGDLRKTETWEKALIANNTVTVEAETIIDEPEVTAEEISEVVEKIYSDLREAQNADEIIPFTHDDNLHLPPNRREMALEELAHQREIFEHHDAIDCPPPPPPAPIIRTCPIPERQDLPPGIEIAEKPADSPIPGEGRGDDRLKNLGDRLFEKIKADVFNYLDSIRRWIIEQFDYFDVSHTVNEFQSINKTEINIFEFIKQAIKLVTRIKEKQIPWYLQKDIPAPPVWFQINQDDYFLLLERPGPIPTLSIDYGGEFIPNRYHELGSNIYCWKFPNQLRAEEYFELIERATNYQFIPASQSQPQLVLTGV